MTKTPTYYELQAFLCTIPSISFGGCGIAALVLYDAAVREGMNPKIIYTYSERTLKYGCNYENNMAAINEGVEDKADCCSHIVLEIDKQWYDCRGLVINNDDRKFHEATRKHLVNSMIYGNWNSDFDRAKYLPVIKKFVGYNALITN